MLDDHVSDVRTAMRCASIHHITSSTLSPEDHQELAVHAPPSMIKSLFMRTVRTWLL
jgi:hypothetical protein